MVNVEQVECLRCGWKWYPKVQRDGTIRVPKLCAKCHSPYYDRPREMR